MHIRFLGAAQTVTGSSYHLRSSSSEMLVDAGMFQGPPDLRKRNWEEPPLDLSKIQAAALTHAHIDHTGRLPLFARLGLDCPVHCTGGTRDLTGVLLLDAARIQEEEAEYRNRHEKTRHKPALPLFNVKDAEQSFKLLKKHRYKKPFGILPGWKLSFQEAGHILGSAWLDLRMGGRRFLFSGDLGTPGSPIIRDYARPTGECDILVLESTYGGETHKKGSIEEELADVVNRVVESGGTLVIPAFAVERTQEIAYLLNQLSRSEVTPRLPIFIDSPMAVRATKLFHRYERYYDEEAQDLIDDGVEVLDQANLKLCMSVQDSKAISRVKGPKIIISASGMATGGRVLHHLKHYLPDPKNHILLVGYQATDTRGARLENGAETVQIFREEIPVRASVGRLEGLSGHGDSQDILTWAKSLEKPPKMTYHSW